MRWLLAALAILFFSCEFEPAMVPFKKVAAPTLDGINVTIVGATHDTLYAYTATNFQCLISASNRELISAKLTFNGTVLLSSTTGGTFTINPSNISSGVYNLRVEVVAKSGNRSLADDLGMETVSGHKDFFVKIDQDIPVPVPITSIEKINGTVRITWQPYLKNDFQKYALSKTVYDDNGKFVEYIFFPPITDSHVTTIEDPGFLAGKVAYNLFTFAADHLAESSTDYSSPYSANLSYELSGNNLKISWDRIKLLDHNFQTYRIDLINTTGTSSYNIFQPSDTTLSVPFVFGDQGKIRLTLASNANESYHPTSEIPVTFGKPFHTFRKDQIHFVNGMYYIKQNSTLYRLDSNGSALDSLTGCSSFKVNNSRVIAIANGQLFTIDPLNFANKAVINYTLDPADIVCSISSNNRIGIFRMLLTSALTILDSNGNTIVWIPDYDYFFIHSTDNLKALSPDGSHVKLEANVLTYNGSTYAAQGNVNNTNLVTTEFSPFDNSLMYGFYKDAVKVIKLSNLSIQTTYSIPNLSYCNFDEAGSKVGCLVGTNFVAYDLNFSQVKSLQVDILAGQFYLLNNTIICSNGVQIALSDLP